MADDPFRLWRRSDFPKLPAMRWAVKDLVVLGGVTLLFGAAKNGKSFVRIPARGGTPGRSVKIDAGADTGRFELGSGGAIAPHGVMVDAVSYGPRGWHASAAVLDALRPILSSGFAALYPLESVGTINVEMPLAPRRALG